MTSLGGIDRLSCIGRSITAMAALSAETSKRANFAVE
jgi:hypothetical protein